MTSPEPAKSSRLKYRAVGQSDRPFLDQLQAEPGVHEFLGNLVVPPASENAALFIAVNGSDTPVGLAGFVKSSAYDGSDVELVCAVAFEHRRDKYAVEACKAVLEWAGSTKSWSRILACVREDNAAALGLARRLGFDAIGRRPTDRAIIVLSRSVNREE